MAGSPGPVVLAVSVALVVLASTGCSDQACLQWTDADGPCPSPAQALAFLQGDAVPGCSVPKVISVDGEGDFDGQACCYDVTERDEPDSDAPIIACRGDDGPSPSGGSTGSASAGGCGDGFCDPSFEICATCPDDCGACFCGDLLCTAGEACDSCPGDCGGCTCGDGVCSAGEDCWTCGADCGACEGCYLGADGCIGCAEIFSQGSAARPCTPDLLCAGSAPLFDAFVSCVCASCSARCPGACSGSAPQLVEACEECALGACVYELSVCSNDTTLRSE